MNLQPTLFDEWVQLSPLQMKDFKSLFQVAQDPLI